MSPEFINTIGPGALMPDNAAFGIIWMPRRAAAAAFDMTGAFNNISLSLVAGTQRPAVIEALDGLLTTSLGAAQAALKAARLAPAIAMQPPCPAPLQSVMD